MTRNELEAYFRKLLGDDTIQVERLPDSDTHRVWRGHNFLDCRMIVGKVEYLSDPTSWSWSAYTPAHFRAANLQGQLELADKIPGLLERFYAQAKHLEGQNLTDPKILKEWHAIIDRETREWAIGFREYKELETDFLRQARDRVYGAKPEPPEPPEPLSGEQANARTLEEYMMATYGPKAPPELHEAQKRLLEEATPHVDEAARKLRTAHKLADLYWKRIDAEAASPLRSGFAVQNLVEDREKRLGEVHQMFCAGVLDPNTPKGRELIEQILRPAAMDEVPQPLDELNRKVAQVWRDWEAEIARQMAINAERNAKLQAAIKKHPGGPVTLTVGSNSEPEGISPQETHQRLLRECDEADARAGCPCGGPAGHVPRGPFCRLPV